MSRRAQSEWRELISQQQSSGVSAAQFCRERSINPKYFSTRKNWLFSESVNGAKASANLYSLVETAKANGLEPYAYLKRVFTELPKVESYDDVDRLLPRPIQENK